MESVKSFNAELSSLYEFKPPISKAKMTALTRGAIKAIKFYKHVVQSVEKFILKCKPEYKIPGLYVIDSIVRQSRHQFGTDKDVFAPRFAKNIQQTFVNLYQCPPEDKSKIIRVLNLWQKNQVFPPDVVQPLFDLADPNNPIYKELGTPAQANGHPTSSLPKGSPALQKTPTKTVQANDSQQGAVNLNLSDPNVLLQLQQLQRLITRSGESKTDSQIHFDKKLLDYDYGDDEEEINPSPKPAQPEQNPVASLLTNPEVLRQLQTLQQTMALAQEVDADKLRKLQEMKQQEEEFDKHLAQTVPNLPFAAECELKGLNPPAPPPVYYVTQQDIAQNQQQNQVAYKNQYEVVQQNEQTTYEVPHNDNDNDVEVINLDHADSSRSPSQERRRRRSRSRSRDRRDRRSRRSRSRSRSRSKRRRSRSREREKDSERKEKETERDKERKKRGLPAIKKDNLSVCSTTLWVGHLSKLVHQDDLSNTFGEFGDIVSIDLISPRGCAFIVMHRRQDAARCLAKLKNHVIHGKAITLAWAPGKGVKGKDLKDYWEGDLGVSYIPYSKIKQDIDLDMLEDGGMIDEETMPEWMKNKVESTSKRQQQMMAIQEVQIALPPQVDTSQPPPMAGGGLLQPPPMSLPLVPPFQFNNRLLGPPNMLNLPPGMMSNVPLGVPPPNLQSQLMTNQLLGIGSPFQGAGLMPPPQLSMGGDNGQGTPESNMKNLTDSLMNLSQSFNIMTQQQPPPRQPQHHLAPPTNMMQQDENMDVEMEDANRTNQDVGHPPPLHQDPRMNSERDRDRNRDDRDRDRRDNRDRDRDRDRDSGRNDRNKERDRRRSRSRDRDRDRERDRDRDRDRNRDRDRDRRGSSRDRNDRDANRDESRDGNRDGNRDRDRGGPRGRDRRDRGRSNRWSDRDRDADLHNDRKERERTLNERLQEIAGGGGVSRPSRDRKDGGGGNQQQPAQAPPPIVESGSQNRPQDELKEQAPPLHEKIQNITNDKEDFKNKQEDTKAEDLKNQNEEGRIMEFVPGPNASLEDFPPNSTPIKDFIPPDMGMDGKIEAFRPMEEMGCGPEDFPGPMGPGPMPFGGQMGPGGPMLPLGAMGIGGPMGPGGLMPPGGLMGPGGPMGPMGGPMIPGGPDGPMGLGGPMGPMDDFPPPMRDDYPPMMDEFGPMGPRDDFGPPMDDYHDDFGPPMRGGRRGGRMPPDDRFGGRRGRRDFRGGHRGRRGPPEFFDDFGPPRDDFGPPRDDFGPPRDDFGPPRDDFGPPRDDFGPPRDDFGPPRDDFGPPRDDFGPPGGDFGPPREDFGPPDEEFDNFGRRDRFGPRGRMRGGHRDFGPRMRGGQQRGFQRGGPRGRGGHWNDRNFNPRFDGPPQDFFRDGGGGRPPRDMYDDLPPPHRRRGRGGGRFEDDRRGPRHYEGGDDGYDDEPHPDFAPPHDDHRPGRKSRWGNESPPILDVSERGGGADEHVVSNEGGVTPVRDEAPMEKGGDDAGGVVKEAGDGGGASKEEGGGAD